MSEEEYLKEVIDDQIAWYGKKSAINKKYYLWSNALIIIFAALIPFLAGFSDKGLVWIKFLIAGLGVLTAAFTGISALFKFEEKWTTYRITAEALRREKILYNTATRPYEKGNETSFHAFVQNTQGIMSNENIQWTQIINKKEDATVIEE